MRLDPDNPISPQLVVMAQLIFEVRTGALEEARKEFHAELMTIINGADSGVFPHGSLIFSVDALAHKYSTTNHPPAPAAKATGPVPPSPVQCALSEYTPSPERVDPNPTVEDSE